MTIYRYVRLRSVNLRVPKVGIILIILILFIWFIRNTPPTEIQRNFAEQVSVSTEPIFLDLGSTKTTIPRNHLNDLSFKRDDRASASILAVAVHPGFEGATAKNIASILRPKGFSIGAVYFTNYLEGSVLFNSDNTLKRRPWYRGPDIELELAEFGLWKQKNSGADLRVWLGSTDTETVTLGCGDRLCQIFFYSEGYFWRVQMGRQLYPHWQDVTNKLRELITEWVEAANEGKK